MDSKTDHAIVRFNSEIPEQRESLEQRGSVDSLNYEPVDWSLKNCILEGLGNFCLVSVILHSSIIQTVKGEDVSTSVVIVVPCMVCVLVYLIAPITQAHFNASVTLIFPFMERHHNVPPSSIKKVLSYIGSQILGALMAAVLIRLLWGPDHLLTTDRNYGPEMNFLKAVVWEFIWTSLLLHVVCAQVHPANARGVFLNAICMVFVISTVIMAAGPFSGGSINPSICFASGIVNLIFNGDAHNFLLVLAYCGAQILAVPCSYYTYSYFICDAYYPDGAIPVEEPVEKPAPPKKATIEDPFLALPDESPQRKRRATKAAISMYDDSQARAHALRVNQAPNLLQNYRSMHE